MIVYYYSAFGPHTEVRFEGANINNRSIVWHTHRTCLVLLRFVTF